MSDTRAAAGRGIDGLKARAKEAAAKLGHDVQRVWQESETSWIGRCERCQLAAVVILPEEPAPSRHTGDYYGGSATRVRCRGISSP